LGLQKLSIFVHNTLFTCHGFAITGHDSCWPGWTQITAGLAHAKAGGAEAPCHPVTLTTEADTMYNTLHVVVDKPACCCSCCYHTHGLPIFSHSDSQFHPWWFPVL